MSDDPAPERIGDYIIDQLLGAGGMAKVYRAHHAVLESVHAIKVLDPMYRASPEARQRFLDEAKIQANRLDHPNIVKVVNIVATPEHAALVMELVDGGSLEAKLDDLKTDPAELRRIMLAVLDAVGYAHAAGIIHRDLKPANVLLAKRGNQLIPKVTDFGIAKITDGGQKRSTHADTRMGTLTYSSPEQLRRAKDVTPRSDVFSLGAILYEMATGAPAFSGDSDYDVMDDIIHARYAPPEHRNENIDPVIAAVIRKALDPEPANRFASCEEMALALQATSVPATPAPWLPSVAWSPTLLASPSLEPSPTSEPSPTLAPPPWDDSTANPELSLAPKRRPLLWIGLGVSVAALLAFAVTLGRATKAARTRDARVAQPRTSAPAPPDAATIEAATIDASTEPVAAQQAIDEARSAGIVEKAAPKPKGEHVHLGQPVANGELDAAVIRRYIARNASRFHYCYEKELLARPDLAGTVTIQFFITPSGSVATSAASGVSPEVANCVADVVKGIEFPKPKGASGVQVNYPMTFRQ